MAVAFVLLAAVAVSQPPPGWTDLRPPSAPPFRASEGLAFEPYTGRVVAYGGLADMAATMIRSDTWSFDGTTWTQIATAGGPGPRLNVHLARSPAPGRLLLFGGATAVRVVDGRTWELDVATATWTDVTPVGPNPSPRQAAALAYDSSRARTVLFGGTDGYNARFYGDTWEWDGRAWTDVTPAAGPSARAWHAMAFDPSRGRTVLFGGYDGRQLGDTWEWDGTNWIRPQLSGSPSPRSSVDIAYDQRSQQIVLFGGSHGWPVGLNDTWHYDGSGWSEASLVGTLPPPQYLHRVVEDPLGRGVMVYGAFGNGWVGLNDTWLYVVPTSPATFRTFGRACAGSAGVPVLAPAAGQLPWIGRVFTIGYSNLPRTVLSPVLACIGFSNTMWGPIPLPVALGPVGMPGCSAYIDLTFPELLANAGGGGQATWPIPIPGTSGLVGAQFFVQGVVFDLTANPAGLITTNAGDAVIGRR